MAYKGLFSAKNPHKYKGNPSNIVYRSRWELMIMQKLDEHPDVLEWGSEELAIPYRSPLDNRIHRYFPDFVVKRRGKDGKVSTLMIEVKPYNQTIPPKVQQGKPTRRYLTEVSTWGINSSKWKAAEAYCADRGWQFIKITEKDLGLTF